MDLEKTDLLHAKAYLERELQRSGWKDSLETEGALRLLSTETDDGSLAYQLWEMGDREKIDHHFRDFGYTGPEDVLESLERMDGKKPDRKHTRELRAITDYTLEELENVY